ncbi:hypothetical protein E2C01_051438 [Portunus trituberculatus]|uniref:Uncharacterized protein n=1 Tax=Portunus trituberculatus TaxID=210409 RepID=A0A5B7GKC0_PORTR|nr:hypothetical protein [Portunus trituberculatus]
MVSQGKLGCQILRKTVSYSCTNHHSPNPHHPLPNIISQAPPITTPSPSPPFPLPIITTNLVIIIHHHPSLIISRPVTITTLTTITTTTPPHHHLSPATYRQSPLVTLITAITSHHQPSQPIRQGAAARITRHHGKA